MGYHESGSVRESNSGGVMKKGILLLLVFMICLPMKALAIEKQHIYSTWETMEIDKIASLWLIKKFIDTKAAFKFYPKGTMEMAGTQVDTPLSEFRRTQNSTTYESLLRKNKFSDPSLLYIGQLVRDMEINIWGKKLVPESHGIDIVMKGIIIDSGGNPHKCIEKGFIVLDVIYKALEAKK